MYLCHLENVIINAFGEVRKKPDIMIRSYAHSGPKMQHAGAVDNVSGYNSQIICQFPSFLEQMNPSKFYVFLYWPFHISLRKYMRNPLK